MEAIANANANASNSLWLLSFVQSSYWKCCSFFVGLNVMFIWIVEHVFVRTSTDKICLISDGRRILVSKKKKTKNKGNECWINLPQRRLMTAQHAFGHIITWFGWYIKTPTLRLVNYYYRNGIKKSI